MSRIKHIIPVLVIFAFALAFSCQPSNTNPEYYTLTTAVSGGSGTITRSPDSNSYHDGMDVSLTVIPGTGYSFDHWEGDLSGSDNPATIEMDSDKSVTAVLVGDLYTLTVNTVGSGTVTVSPDQEEYSYGDTVTLTAVPGASNELNSWSGDIHGITESIDITITGDMTVTANFINPTGLYELTLTESTHGSALPDPCQRFFGLNADVSVTATGSGAYVFSGWTGDVPSGHENDNPCDIVMNSDKTLTPNFMETSWTIMVVLDGDNNLESAAIEDLNEMEAVDLSGQNVNVLVLMDRIPGYDSTNDNWEDTRLYEVAHDSDGVDGTIDSTRIAIPSLGITASGASAELNMGDPDVISDFIDFVQAEYTADHYALIFWNHGSGWRAAPPVERQSVDSGVLQITDPLVETDRTGNASDSKVVCVDDTNGGDYLYTEEVGDAIAGLGIEVIGFDACLEGMIEVAWEIRNDSDYMIASEESIPGDGWEYDDLLSSFINAEHTADSLCSAAVDAYETRYSGTVGTTLSAVDISQLGTLKTAIDALSDAIIDHANALDISSGATAANNFLASVRTCLANDPEDYYNVPGDLNIDIYDMAFEIQTTFADFDTEAAAVMTALNNAVPYEWHDLTNTANYENTDSHGLAIYLVSLDSYGSPSVVSSAYDATSGAVCIPAFVEDSRWSYTDINGDDGLLFYIWDPSPY
ncbi:MAG: hypothetical protein JW874_13895 [Spirochaetales bacterium]|nr:hypothetical protein [Spirochaetales bacterium]